MVQYGIANNGGEGVRLWRNIRSHNLHYRNIPTMSQWRFRTREVKDRNRCASVHRPPSLSFVDRPSGSVHNREGIDKKIWVYRSPPALSLLKIIGQQNFEYLTDVCSSCLLHNNKKEWYQADVLLTATVVLKKKVGKMMQFSMVCRTPQAE